MPELGVSLAAQDPMLPAAYRVVERRQETHDTVTLALSSGGVQRTAKFLPGQFSMLYAFGVGEVPISISGDASRHDRLVHTIRSVGAVSRALVAAPVGTMIGFRGPFGSPWPMAASRGKDLLLVAGGIGLAPLRPMIYHALENRSAYANISILVGARSEQDLLFSAEFSDWRQRGAQVLVTLDAASPEWQGHVGVVTRLIPAALVRPRCAVAMICGPEVMMRYCIQALRDRGLPDSQIFLTMERNMKCAVGFCGHCQYGADFICKDGAVLPLPRILDRFFLREI